MKRALAERAKQQQSSLASQQQEQPKKMKLVKQQSVNTKETTNNDFYLQHQNRALATELQSLQSSVRELQKERDARRAHCRAAFATVVELAAVYNGIEEPTTSSSTLPPSTGTGEAVEWTGALQRAVKALTAASKGETTTTPPIETPLVDKARCIELKEQMAEMAASRQQVTSRERRVRRNVYRMAAGMLTPEQVVNSLEACEDEIEAQVKLEQTALPKQEEQPVVIAESSECKEKMESLEASIARSETCIQDLNRQISQKEERITELSLRQLTPDDAKRLELLESTSTQLGISQHRVASLEQKLERKESRWAQALGNEKAVVASSQELVAKFNKRWSELTGTTNGEDEEEKKNNEGEDGRPELVLTRQVGELQHKLEQALEHVRQAETTRENLKIALEMNGSLQAKLDEVKTKYAAVQSTRNTPNATAATTSSKSNNHSSTSRSGDHKPSSSSKESSNGDVRSSSSNDAKAIKHQKMYESYKRAKQEVVELTARKDALKSKLERTEKDRDVLMESNRKLLKQIGEKDEMNATSLSTILHLKSQTDRLSAERNQLEEQARAASQLALAARLATHAKEKVSEEVVLQKEELEKRVQTVEKESALLRADLEKVSKQWSEAGGKVAVKELELKNVLERSRELVSENEQKREEIRRLTDLISKTKHQEQTQKMKTLKEEEGARDSTPSAFSVDQLQTQILFLKNRLACPVCHYRDKECIISRCRHMHCKPCVEEQISNRSRKCPTCNVKFSENDVGDIWLK